MFTIAFWKGATERAIKTAAQSLLATIGVTGLTFGAVDWGVALSVASLAALASVLTSIVNPSPVPASQDPELAEAQAIAAANTAAVAEDLEAQADETVDELPAYDGSDPDAEYSGHATQDEPGRHQA
ncbi:MAG: holin [Arthrobacter sp.]|nr:holin [Arthrobacter sp.]